MIHGWWPIAVAAGLAVACAPTERGMSGDCADAEWTGTRLLGLDVGEALGDSWVLSGSGLLPGDCGTSAFAFHHGERGLQVEALARRTEEASSCTCRTRNFCVNFRDAATVRDLTPAEVPADLLREVCLTAGERDRGLLLDAGVQNAAYRWVLVALGVLVLAGVLHVLLREAFSPETPRWVAPALGSIVLLAGILRYFLSEWNFVHEYFHFGNTIGSYLYSDALDMHGEVGPALYRATEALFGLDEDSVFGTNAVLATLTVPLLALLDYLLFRSWPRALFSAFVLAVLPHHLRVSASEDLFIPMVLFSVSGLALAVRHLETGGRGTLALSSAALFLAAQSRPEGALTVVFLGLMVVAGVRRGWPRVVTRPATWVALAGLAAAVVLQRTLFGSGAESLVAEVNPIRLPWPQLWLDPEVTPPVLPALCVVSLVAAFRGRDLVSLGLLAAGEASVYASLVFFDSETYNLRSQVAAVPYLVLFAAGGFEFLRRFVAAHRASLAVFAGLLLFSVSEGMATRIPFIRADTPDADVADFIRDSLPEVPDGPGITMLAHAQFTPFPRDLVWRERRLIRMVELERWARGEEPGLTCENLIVFEAPGCFVGDWTRVTDDEMDPACAAVRRACRLEPMFTKEIEIPRGYGQVRFGRARAGLARRDDRPDVITIGFYRAAGPAKDSR